MNTRADEYQDKYNDLIVYLRLIYEPHDIVEFRAIRSQGATSRYKTPEAIQGFDDTEFFDWLDRNKAEGAICAGPNPRLSNTGSGKGGVGTDRDVAHAQCLFADFDDRSRNEVESAIETAGMPEPTLLIATRGVDGNGWHAYWRMHEPFTCINRWRVYQSQLIQLLGSDPAIKNPARIMRVPGFFNHKRDAPCIIVKNNPARYKLDELPNAIRQATLNTPIVDARFSDISTEARRNTAPCNSVQNLLDRLQGVRENGDGWMACCPAHDDHTPSLSIANGDNGRALVKCFAGCDTQDVLTSIGLTMRDLMPETPFGAVPAVNRDNSGRGFVVYKNPTEARDALIHNHGKYDSIWAYWIKRDEAAAVVLRWNGDGDTIEHTISRVADGWIIGPMPTPRPLYDMPGLTSSSRVFVVGSEEAADRAYDDLGVRATTSAGGPSEAHKTDWTTLAGKEVIILPTNSKADERYAKDVAEILKNLKPKPVVKVMQLPDLPEGNDVLHFINARAAELPDIDWVSDEFRKLADAADPVGAEFFGGGNWPPVTPLPNELPAVMPYRSGILPPAMRAFVDDVAARLQCPPDYIAAALLVVLGSVIGRRCGIRPWRRDNWLVVPNLWGAVIGRPSQMKSPAIKAAMKMLQRLEAESRQQHETTMSEYQKHLMLAEAKKKHTEQKIRDAVKLGKDTASLLDEMDGAKPAEPTRIRFLCNDATVEKIGELLAANPFGLMVFRDELVGWFYSLDKDNQQGARAFFLEAWDGDGRFTYDRIGRGTVEMEAACVSVFGGIQPGRFASYIRSAIEGGSGDDGFIQRFQVLVWPDEPKQWKNVDRYPDTAARQRVFDVIKRLIQIDAENVGGEVDEFDHTKIPYLHFDEPAQMMFDEWYEKLELRLRSEQEHPAIEAHFGKYRSLIPSIALILHLAVHEKGPVGLPALKLAINWGRYLESHARRVYSAASSVDAIAAAAIWRRVLRDELPDPFNARDVYRHGWAGLGDAEAVKTALVLLVDHGYLVEQMQPQEQQRRLGRRPLTLYTANPLAIQRTQTRAE